jgi:hypothetical protein
MEQPVTMIAARLRSAVVALKRVSDLRHGLTAGTPEYEAALEMEVRLAEEVRRLTDLQAIEDE